VSVGVHLGHFFSQRLKDTLIITETQHRKGKKMSDAIQGTGNQEERDVALQEFGHKLPKGDGLPEDIRATAIELLQCFGSWQADVRVLGNVKAISAIECLHYFIDAAEKQVGWIGLSDLKPDPSECVDLWGSVIGGHHHGDESRVENCFYDDARQKWWKWDDACRTRLYLDSMNFTHWMSLPHPPID